MNIHLNKGVIIGMIVLVFMVGGTALHAASATQYEGFANPAWGQCGSSSQDEVSGTFTLEDPPSQATFYFSFTASSSDSEQTFWWCTGFGFNHLVLSNVNSWSGSTKVCTLYDVPYGSFTFTSSSYSNAQYTWGYPNNNGQQCFISPGQTITYQIDVYYGSNSQYHFQGTGSFTYNG
jgi:hypothetical protein